MAEQFLTLMADFDDDSQTIMSAWYNSLIQAGFSGTQTTNLPFHISMASFPLEKEQEAAELTKKFLESFLPSLCISAISEYLLLERYCSEDWKETLNWIYFTMPVKQILIHNVLGRPM